METKQRVGAAVVQETETADLISLEAVVARIETARRGGDLWHAEHADLLVQVAQVRDLEQLRFRLEARQSIGTEESVRGVELMAAVTRLQGVGCRRAHEKIPSPLLIRREGVVERADGVGRIRDLQDEIGERLHLRVA